MTKRTPRLCSVEGCEKLHDSRGYCINHYLIARRAGAIDLLPKVPPPPVHNLSAISEDETLADCDICGPRVQTYVQVEAIVCFKGWRDHRDTINAKRRAIAGEQRERLNAYHRDYLRHAKHGLERGDIAAMLEACGWKCQACGTDITLQSSRVDHDHACCPSINVPGRRCGQCIRGMLCQSCNSGLGLLGDNSAGVGRALAYLLRAEQRLALRAVR